MPSFRPNSRSRLRSAGRSSVTLAPSSRVIWVSGSGIPRRHEGPPSRDRRACGPLVTGLLDRPERAAEAVQLDPLGRAASTKSSSSYSPRAHRRRYGSLRPPAALSQSRSRSSPGTTPTGTASCRVRPAPGSPVRVGHFPVVPRSSRPPGQMVGPVRSSAFRAGQARSAHRSASPRTIRWHAPWCARLRGTRA